MRGEVRAFRRRVVATLLASTLAALGLSAVTAAPALVAGPAVSAPAVPAAGGTITLTGSGFAAAGIYLCVGPAGFYAGSGSLLSTETCGSLRATPMTRPPKADLRPHP